MLLEDTIPTSSRREDNKDVVLIPDAMELVSDKDSEEEEDTQGVGMDVNHLGRGILRQVAEINFNDCDDEEPDMQRINDEGDVMAAIMDETEEMEEDEEEDVNVAPGPSRKRHRGQVPAAVPADRPPQLSRKKNKDRRWSQKPAAEFGKKIPAFQAVPPSTPVPDEAKLPYDFLRLFLNDSFMDKVIL